MSQDPAIPAISEFPSEEAKEPRLRYVNAYAVSRHYGGPEEGGWYYDSGRAMASVPCLTDDEVCAAKKSLQEKLGWPVGPTRQGRFSVAGDEDFELHIEEGVAADYPTETPHYE